MFRTLILQIDFIMSSWRSILVVAVLTLTVSACQTLSPLTAPNVEAESQARIAIQSGDFLDAAQQYEALAKSSGGSHRARLYIQSAAAYWQLGQVEQARANLAQVDVAQLTPALAFDKDLLEAKIALNQLNAEGALSLLEPYKADNLTAKQQRALLRTRIQAYQETENWLEKANTHILLDNLLPASEREQNQQQLWQALMSLTPKALELFNPGLPPAVDSGWFMLAYTIKAYQDKPNVLVVALEDWQRTYPNHPASPSLYQQSVSTGTLLPQQLANITVLLPKTGPYAQVSEAIKQGISAAHYAANATSQIHFIDIETDAISGQSNVLSAYQRAIDLNASLVIGPLDKGAIQRLAQSVDLPIPVLALNRLPGIKKIPNLYQFGLAPENDAMSAAKNAMAKGYQRAIIFAPEAEWGQRIANAFEAQWLSQGGVLLGKTIYNELDNDYSSTITPAFGLTSSEQRYQSLKRTLGTPIEFEPRRRQDIDVIFLAARPLKARQLVPQFKFHRSGQLPIIATSQAYSGIENSQQDIDLNSLFINDIPWVFPEIAERDPAYQVLQQQQPASFNQLIRLYALGVDAYRLANELNRLSHSPTDDFQGATGLISIDDNGYVNRQLQWATFSSGKIQALPNPNLNSALNQ